jgi:hypothetical protein
MVGPATILRHEGGRGVCGGRCGSRRIDRRHCSFPVAHASVVVRRRRRQRRTPRHSDVGVAVGASILVSSASGSDCHRSRCRCSACHRGVVGPATRSSDGSSASAPRSRSQMASRPSAANAP